MWTITYTSELITDLQCQLQDRESYMREADFSTNLVSSEKRRQELIVDITRLEEILKEMNECNSMATCLDSREVLSALKHTMNDYVAQKALVYTLIEDYKLSISVRRELAPLSDTGRPLIQE
jgi:predicted component of type VI protein secretion system